jgi:cobalt-zinc-cadmium efflux system outer membrane protein
MTHSFRSFPIHAVVACALAGSSLLLGQSAEAPPSVSVDSLVQQILTSNPELKFYEAEIVAAKGDLRSAATWSNPELSASIGQKRVRSAGALSDGTAWSVSVRQTFEWSGRIALRKAIANQQVKLAALGLAQFRTALAARARVLAYQLFAAQEKAAASREVAERFAALREVLVQRDTAGLTPVLETRIIEATALTVQRHASEDEVSAQAALLELNQLRGQPWEQTLKVEAADFAFGEPPDLPALISAAQTNNFELQLRKAELEQQGFRVSLARNEQMPAVSVGPYLSKESAGDSETQFGIGVSMPLPLWNRNTGKIAAEEARRTQAETSMLVAQRTVERQVAEKAMTFRAKLAEITKWRSDSVQQFKEAAALADRHYRVGAVPISTYVELQKQYLEAVQALLDTRKEVLEAGQDLERLTGLEFGAVRAVQPGEAKP